MSVEIRRKQVFYSGRRKRHFLTAFGAARAEANARMLVWFPTEPDDFPEGRGWHFSNEPRLVEIRDRLTRRYVLQIRTQLAKEPT